MAKKKKAKAKPVENRKVAMLARVLVLREKRAAVMKAASKSKKAPAKKKSPKKPPKKKPS